MLEVSVPLSCGDKLGRGDGTVTGILGNRAGRTGRAPRRQKTLFEGEMEMRYKLLILVISAAFLTGCSGMLTSGALHSARGEIDDKEYREALSSLTDANFSGLSQEQLAEVSFLRAKALFGLMRTDEAEAVLRFIIVQYPDTKYTLQAKALLAKWSKYKSSE